MKINILFCFLFLFALNTIQAQGGRGGERREEIKEKIEAARVAYLTTQLDLTSEESQRFWPIYNSFRDKLEEDRPDGLKGKHVQDLSDKEIEDLIESHFQKQERAIATKRQMYTELRKVVSVRKLVKLPKAEQGFKEVLLEKMHEKREERMKNK
jgi:hypothetical protein